MKRYLTKGLGWKKWLAAVGIRADESKRAKSDSKDRWSYWYPLLEANIFKEDVVSFWDKQDFNLNLNSANGVTPKGNCDFLFSKSEHILASIKQHPERAEWWVKMEQEMGSTFRHGRDMRQFVDFATRQQDWIFDEEGYFCQKDEGECTAHKKTDELFGVAARLLSFMVTIYCEPRCFTKKRGYGLPEQFGQRYRIA